MVKERVGVDATDAALVLPDVHIGHLTNGRWIQARGHWSIQTPRAKLLAKYTSGTSAIFGHYVYRYPHRERNRITAVDMEAANRLMGANIDASHDRWKTVGEAGSSPAFIEALARVPVEASIYDAQYDDAICAAIATLTQHPGVKLAIATKLLCIKRPALMPMMDSLVQYCFNSADPAHILREFRRLLSIPEISARMDDLAMAVSAQTGFAPTSVRILDELIWFDWNIKADTKKFLPVVGFKAWGFAPANPELGVHRGQNV